MDNAPTLVPDGTCAAGFQLDDTCVAGLRLVGNQIPVDTPERERDAALWRRVRIIPYIRYEDLGMNRNVQLRYSA